MWAGAMKMAGIARLVLGTRHATLRRTDLGTYSIETFCRLSGYALELTTGVREAECTALRPPMGQGRRAIRVASPSGRPGPPGERANASETRQFVAGGRTACA